MNALIGNFSHEEQTDAQTRNDGRTDFEWKSECGLLVLLRTGEGFMICCCGFYDPWLGSLEQAIEYLNNLGDGEED